MKEKKSPSPPSLPPDAQREILGRLSTETRISSQEIAAILKRHGVCGDIDALQDAYRKRLGQRLTSTIRDEAGKREVLAASGGEYVIVDCCNDPQKLKAIRHRIQAQMNGLDVSARKVRKRVRFLGEKGDLGWSGVNCQRRISTVNSRRSWMRMAFGCITPRSGSPASSPMTLSPSWRHRHYLYQGDSHPDHRLKGKRQGAIKAPCCFVSR